MSLNVEIQSQNFVQARYCIVRLAEDYEGSWPLRYPDIRFRDRVEGFPPRLERELTAVKATI